MLDMEFYLKRNSFLGSERDPSLDTLFRRLVRDVSERQQWLELVSMIDAVSLSSASDRWVCDFNGDGVFYIKDIRSKLDRLPTRDNLIKRGVNIDSPLCLICGLTLEDSQHLFFTCDMAKCIFQKICRWWNLQWADLQSFEDWLHWFRSIRMSGRSKDFYGGCCLHILVAHLELSKPHDFQCFSS
nr:RNA-directed DNA polymerase, eukaryota [Tanacetum cinerariifolium]